ncbi:hypothetical protein ACOYX4_08870 [Enterococcus entomosocium]
MNDQNKLSLSEILLAFYKVGLALKFEKKPPDQRRIDTRSAKNGRG